MLQVLQNCGCCDKGGAAQPINQCKACYNERRLKQGEEEVAASKWRALVEQKAFRGKLSEAFLAQDVGTFHIQKKAWDISVCQCARHMMRRSQRLGNLLGSILWKWQAQRMGRCEGERMLQSGRARTVLDILRKSTDFLRRIIVAVKGEGGVTLSYLCPHCHRFPLEDNMWWISSGHGKKQCSWWCAACGGQYDWRHPNRIFVIHFISSKSISSAEVFASRSQISWNIFPEDPPELRSSISAFVPSWPQAGNRHNKHRRKVNRHTHRRTQRISNTPHLRFVTEKLENLAGRTIQTNSFILNPFPFSSHLSFPTFYFPRPWLPCSTSPFPLLYHPHPLAANC